MKKTILSAACILFFLCACNGTNNPDITPTPTVDITPTHAVSTIDETEVKQEIVIFPSGPIDPDPFPDIGLAFSLTDTQQALYDKYTKDFNFDISVFAGAHPINAAQVFIECGINGLWEGEYYLLYFDAKHISKAEYKKINDDDLATRDIRTRRGFANYMFSSLKDGTFIEKGDGSGYIEFNSVESDHIDVYEVTLRMNLNQVDGIWKINYHNPFESVPE